MKNLLFILLSLQTNVYSGEPQAPKTTKLFEALRAVEMFHMHLFVESKHAKPAFELYYRGNLVTDSSSHKRGFLMTNPPGQWILAIRDSNGEISEKLLIQLVDDEKGVGRVRIQGINLHFKVFVKSRDVTEKPIRGLGMTGKEYIHSLFQEGLSELVTKASVFSKDVNEKQ